MIFQGEYLTACMRDSGIIELCFNSQGSVNKFNLATLKELGNALSQLSERADCRGLLLTTGKDNFIVGADITEFMDLFALPQQELSGWLAEANAVFNALEDFPAPTLCAIQGYALGGGCECVLATDFRIADNTAKIGLPETKLGIMPGFGGTVRLPRLIGADNALEWIATGQENKAEACLKIGVVDALVATDKLQSAGMAMLSDAAAGTLDWKARRAQKQAPLLLNATEAMMSFATAKAFVAQKAGKHYPAPMAAVNCVEKAAGLDREGALACEARVFVELAQSVTARALIGLFLNDQAIKGIAKKASKNAAQVTDIAVIGAGIMGGGIAYQGAYCGKNVVMKDIAQPALEQGMQEASKILEGLVKKQKINTSRLAATLRKITPTLETGALKQAGVMIEAVVEKQSVKQQVLRELESNCDSETVLTSNTSTIPISTLAQALERPDKFCGMHFFNPVHRMPLVEVIRGAKTSDTTVDTVVALAAAMRKSPIVVKDCPGFFVNRVLFPYLFALGKLIEDGVDYTHIDHIMEKEFGWPMGPAYLLDVIGLDTAQHAGQVMADGFPDRMGASRFTAVETLLDTGCLGQKNAKGFYLYAPDKKGKLKKQPHPEIMQKLYKSAPSATPEASDIIARMMLPMLNEVARCLDEGIVSAPSQADMALIYGVGFPPFRGGACQYIDTLGIENYLQMTEKWGHLGAMYAPSAGLLAMARDQKTYYPQTGQPQTRQGV